MSPSKGKEIVPGGSFVGAVSGTDSGKSEPRVFVPRREGRMSGKPEPRAEGMWFADQNAVSLSLRFGLRGKFCCASPRGSVEGIRFCWCGERDGNPGSPSREPRECGSRINARFPSACASGFEAMDTPKRSQLGRVAEEDPVNEKLSDADPGG